MPYKLDKLEGVVGRIQQKIYYENITNIFNVAGLYCEAIARGHAFPDANKRTAFVCTITVLAINGVFPDTLTKVANELETSSYPVELMVEVAQGKYDYKEIGKVLTSMFLVGGAIFGIIKLVDYFTKK